MGYAGVTFRLLRDIAVHSPTSIGERREWKGLGIEQEHWAAIKPL